ncbi:MAG: insulinase family protein [Candidatus Delongbacteria bacterium]|nr:insulinase family protein [Candidatus Delongbacteria bacterium]MBN2835236.1 insulinase family protein [Candidatus Delongbacteria bacterium]
MELKIGEIYEGFKLISTDVIDEIKSEGALFVHEKTGAELLYMKSDDDNKVFMSAFKTPPEDNTGLPHILEHSVLAGSEKFKTKDPFTDLWKSSLQTFLNAMTYPEKTVYPVASRNKKDFKNLCEVYLDAVFNPIIYKQEEVFLQEGWHYDILSKDNPLKINGVVYNEMQGAFSSPDSILQDEIMKSLFPDNQYSNNSGGIPVNIPELTYENFLDFHRKYYHPSNTRLFLFGDMDLMEHLEQINDGYLSKFDKIEIDTEIKDQKSFDEIKKIEAQYAGEKGQNRDYLSYNVVVGDIENHELSLAMHIVADLLMDSPFSPVKLALTKKGIGKDIFGTYESEIKQPVFSIISKYTTNSKRDEFLKTIEDSLKEVVEKGFDKELIIATLTSFEFQLKEAGEYGEPKGLVYGLKALNGWLHGKNPFDYIKYQSLLDKFYDEYEHGYFEKIVENHIINNNHKTIVSITPDPELGQRRQNELVSKLETKKRELSDKDIEILIQKKNSLLERQNREDTPEEIATIPVLDLKDIDRKPEEINFKHRKTAYGEYIAIPQNTSGIVYINHYFDISDLDERELFFASALATLIGDLDTKAHKYGDLSNIINTVTGGLDFDINVLPEVGKIGKYEVKLVVKTKVLEKNIEKYMPLLEEIIFNTIYENFERALEVIDEKVSELEDKIKNGGYAETIRALSNTVKCYRLIEVTKGIEFYKFMRNLSENYKEKQSDYLNTLAKKIFTSGKLTVAISGDEEFLVEKNNILRTFGDSFPYREKGDIPQFKLNERSEAFMFQSDVQYVVTASNMAKQGVVHNGSLFVIENLLTSDHLMNLVRWQGGAYGVRATFDRSGYFVMSSYRDPNLDKTFQAFVDSVSYLNKLNITDKDLERYIIGTISSLDHPFSPKQILDRTVSRYFMNISYEYLSKEREEVLNTKVADIKKFASNLTHIFESSVNFVLGGEEQIEKSECHYYSKEKLF